MNTSFNLFDRQGCWSNVGRIPWDGGQQLSLNRDDGCWDRGVVIHEIGEMGEYSLYGIYKK